MEVNNTQKQEVLALILGRVYTNVIAGNPFKFTEAERVRINKIIEITKTNGNQVPVAPANIVSATTTTFFGKLFGKINRKKLNKHINYPRKMKCKQNGSESLHAESNGKFLIPLCLCKMIEMYTFFVLLTFIFRCNRHTTTIE